MINVTPTYASRGAWQPELRRSRLSPVKDLFSAVASPLAFRS